MTVEVRRRRLLGDDEGEASTEVVVPDERPSVLLRQGGGLTLLTLTVREITVRDDERLRFDVDGE